MIFNSFDFLLFLPIVFVFFWSIPSKNILFRNLLLLFASYFFYSCWDFRFLTLLIFSTLLDFYLGNKIFEVKTINQKKIWLSVSVLINLSVLGLFKYFNFFSSSFVSLINHFGLHITPKLLELIMPIGISFYTFHGLSYVFDIYNRKIEPEKSVVNYSLFVSFFPLLVAGPIERAAHLLPQLKTEKKFNYIQATKGLRQILWGLFKKIVIADNCAVYVDQIYNYESGQNGVSLLFASILFAFQIYGDFSGYSDIALGTARLFGVELIKNFSFPYFARDIAEFWRRWHISLTTWFRDYLYIPLGGSKAGMFRVVLNTFLIFIVSGFWHGANWTYIVWGVLNAFYFLPLLLLKRNRKHTGVIAESTYYPSIKELLQVIFTFTLVVLAWVFFRAPDLDTAFRIFQKIILFNTYQSLTIYPQLRTVLLVIFMLIIEWVYRKHNFALETMDRVRIPVVRYIFYFVLIFMLFYFGAEEKQFIYFQF